MLGLNRVRWKLIGVYLMCAIVPWSIVCLLAWFLFNIFRSLFQ